MELFLTLTTCPFSSASVAQRCIQEEMVDAIKRYAREVADLKVWNLCGYRVSRRL